MDERPLGALGMTCGNGPRQVRSRGVAVGTSRGWGPAPDPSPLQSHMPDADPIPFAKPARTTSRATQASPRQPPVRPVPIPGLFVTGTDTGVGKTVVAGMVADWFRRRGARVAVLKPVATGCVK